MKLNKNPYIPDEWIMVSLPVAGWHSSLHAIKHDEYWSYRRNPVAFAAKEYGVSERQYLAWLEADAKVQCSAVTTTGRRCKQFVKPDPDVSTVRLWVGAVERGGYCSTHGGKS